MQQVHLDLGSTLWTQGNNYLWKNGWFSQYKGQDNTEQLKGHINYMSHWECNELQSHGALEDEFLKFMSGN